MFWIVYFWMYSSVTSRRCLSKRSSSALGLSPCQTSASRAVRLMASWMPPFMPMPPSGLLMWAASPTRKHAAEPEGLRHPLVHLVERDVRDLVVRDARHHARHQRLRELARLHALVAGVLVDQEHRPATAREFAAGNASAPDRPRSSPRSGPGMTCEKSNGVDTTSSRSGQVKPSNSMPSERRTALLAPSAPIS